MRVLKTDSMKLPAFIWADESKIDSEAMKQIVNLSNLPFAFKHISIMPDVHGGYGMPIGSVLACVDAIIPHAVGKDIGCGMACVKTHLNAKLLSRDMLRELEVRIREVIPVGFEHQKEAQDLNLMPLCQDLKCNSGEATKAIKELPIVSDQFNSARKQLGTLGGGNHFIEIQKDKDDFVYIMIHSGSRNLGSKVCDYYNQLAILKNREFYSEVKKEVDLAFFPLHEKYFNKYMSEMEYCVDFAKANRGLIMKRVLEVFNKLTNKYNKTLHIEIPSEPIIDIAHNYAKFENHFGQNVIVHRKGATLARTGTIGIIPGSQGSKSYIVRGLGNENSFNSCSHGAGRLMSRKKARKELNLQEEIKKMDDMGIVHGIKTVNDLDEASGAYKDIDEVMANQKDLVEILVELQPLAVVKDNKQDEE